MMDQFGGPGTILFRLLEVIRITSYNVCYTKLLRITGGKGFIAKSLTEQLTKNNKYKIFSPSSKELSLINESDVDNFIISNKIDIIIHTANKGGGRDSLDFKNLTEYNLRMFFNIAKHEKNVKKIISFGSGAEYGKHKPIIEVKEDEYRLAQPISYNFV